MYGIHELNLFFQWCLRDLAIERQVLSGFEWIAGSNVKIEICQNNIW